MVTLTFNIYFYQQSFCLHLYNCYGLPKFSLEISTTNVFQLSFETGCVPYPPFLFGMAFTAQINIGSVDLLLHFTKVKCDSWT